MISIRRKHWRGWCKPTVAGFYIVLLLTTLPLLVYKFRHSDNRDDIPWFVSGLFVLLTLPIFLTGLLQHILNYTQPHLQKHIIRILWVVPIYSLNSWLALVVPEAAVYLDTLRECYEAYVLYNFLCYLCNYLTSEYNLEAELEARPIVMHPIPWCCLSPWPKGTGFIKRCRIGVLQYTVVRVLVTVVALITQLCKVYTKGAFSWTNAWIYLSIINVISQAIALHSLIYFYKGTNELLRPINPIGKFISIKAIVFAMFWQAVLIAMLVKFNVIPERLEGPQEMLQNFVVVIEMLLFAVAHYFIFSHRPYIDPAAAQVPCIDTCLRMLDVRDVAGDVKEHFVDPFPRPRFRIKNRNLMSTTSTTDAASITSAYSSTGTDSEVGENEDTPLLNKTPPSRHTTPSSSSHGRGGVDGEESSDTGQSRKEQLSEVSYAVLSYKELDSRTAYGTRARLIADMGKSEDSTNSSPFSPT